MYLVYSAALALGLLITLPYWLLQIIARGKYRAGFTERIGRVPRRLASDNRPTIWIHAVSLGEVLAVSGLVAELQKEFPGYRIAVSTTTDTGQKLARTRFGEENVFYFPLDFRFAIAPYLEHLRPALVVLTETELWPNFLRLSARYGARIAVVNARISDRSLPRYRRWRRLWRSILLNVDMFLTQTAEDKRRLIEIGASSERVQVSGNLKFDVAVLAPPSIVSSLQAAFQRFETRPILVCGSTVEGEELLLLNAFRNIVASHPHTALILAPRHPERFGEVARIVEQVDIRYYRRSLWSGECLSGSVLLLDTIGELASIYSLADAAFVGGSLVPRGGHNIIEPAQYGAPIVVGHHTENFRDIIALFESRNAICVVGPSELPLILMELVADEAKRKALGQRAAETWQSQTGATKRTIQAISNLLASKATNDKREGAHLSR